MTPPGMMTKPNQLMKQPKPFKIPGITTLEGLVQSCIDYLDHQRSDPSRKNEPPIVNMNSVINGRAYLITVEELGRPHPEPLLDLGEDTDD